ncbi:UCH-domain-containing protein [Tothia fuscella]|uniref:ubiquitinyl hydrolase 1 n=1 Tax=Tothia fuscella TaxID=1048955 RepID=A0A9P4NL81_9PEZI|nr:UCH-domain-containing protein [Tothia fuscella]
MTSYSDCSMLAQDANKVLTPIGGSSNKRRDLRGEILFSFLRVRSEKNPASKSGLALGLGILSLPCTSSNSVQASLFKADKQSCLYRKAPSLADGLPVSSARRLRTSLLGPQALQAFTTASVQKKRKLNDKASSSSSSAAITPRGAKSKSASKSPRDTPSPTSSHSHAYSQYSQSRATPGRTTTASPDPPRFIPPHLHHEVLDLPTSHKLDSTSNTTARESRNTTAASSPSDAYAGLTLDSEEGAAGMSVHRRDSLTFGDDAATQAVNTMEESSENLNSPTATKRQKSRSASPAKRGAAEMEGQNTSDGDLNMDLDLDRTLLPVPPSKPSDDQEGNGERKESNTTTSAARNTRDTSVDMLGTHQTGQSAASSTTTNASPKSSVSDKIGSVSSNSTSGATTEDKPMEDVEPAPSLDDQVKIILEKTQGRDPEDGEVGYAVACSWLQRVLARCEEGQSMGPFDKDALEGEIGPVDNTALLPRDLETLDHSLLDDQNELFVPLSPALRYGDDFYILPKEAYDLVVQWYGLVEGQPVIKRYAHSGLGANVQWENHPPIFTLRKLQSSNFSALKHSIQDGNKKAPRIVASTTVSFQTFLKRVKAATKVPKTTKVRLWRVLETQATEVPASKTSMISMLSPPASREVSPDARRTIPPLAISTTAFSDLNEGTDVEKVDLKDQSNDDNYNGSMTLGVAGLGADQVLIIDEQEPKGNSDTFASDSVKKSTNKHGLSLKKGGLLSGNSSGRSSPSGGIMTRGRNRAKARSKGATGLSNLGNTCYMNSALQCIRATEELTAFFLEGDWKEDINADNVLGHGGLIAKTYASFLDSVYVPGQSSFTPRNFKTVLGKCGPQFSGYGQQDSQEFMSFLVDALHEDLNRIREKPYSENPDSDDNTVNDPEAVKALGEVFRKNFRARNDSVVMDLFNGFYKNTMVCPDCNKVSITFDPYSLLTLQLPIEHSWQGQITLFPLYGKPVTVEIDMDKHATIRTLKDYVAAKVPGLDSKRLMFAEVFGHKFFRTVDDKQTIMEVSIGTRDDMIMYELDMAPSNFPAPKKKPKKPRSMLNLSPDSGDDDIPTDDSPLSDRMLVPVFHRAQNNSYNTTRALTLTPTFITLTREDAQNYDEIYRKVLNQCANATTRDIFGEVAAELSSTETTPEVEQDAVMTTEDDASSNADPSIQARSVDSEDGIVGVSIVDADQSIPDAESEVDEATTKQSPPRNRYSFMEPGSDIPKNLRGLFELKYIPAGNDMIQTAWSSFDQNRNFPELLARVPKPARRMSTESTTSLQSGKISSESSDVDETPEPAMSAPTSFANEPQSDDEPELFSAKPSFKTNGKQNRKNKNKNKSRNKHKHVYGKKNRKNNKNGQSFDAFAAKQMSEDESDATTGSQTDGNPAIIRLGEAIVIDWNLDAFNALFGGRNENELAGQEARKHQEVLEDAELKEKRKLRAVRKKNGVSLEECFKESAKGEILTEENAWYCNRCRALRRASKQLEIWTTPDILVVHLKRFSANRQFRDKIDVLVDFPIEGLDLNGKVGLTEGKNMTYDLFAVDNHYGGLGGGHYTAFAKNFVDNEWYEYNDSMVSRRQPSAVVTTAAYLLFYRRRSANALGSANLDQIVHNLKNPADSETNSDGDSRSGSPSGKGQRLDGSSHKYTGSSSALVVVGVGHPPHGGDGSVAKAARGIDEDYDAEGEADAEEDEGISMAIGPQLPNKHVPVYGELSNSFDIKDVTNQPGWQWTSMGGVGNQDADKSIAMLSDDGSMNAANGDDDGYEDSRMLEDFGDDFGGYASGHHNSPVVVPLGQDHYPDIPDLIGDSGGRSGEDDSIFEDTGPVAEINLDDGA